MELFVSITVSVVAVWTITMALLLSSSSIKGKILFKVIPFFMGVALGISALYLWGVI